MEVCFRDWEYGDDYEIVFVRYTKYDGYDKYADISLQFDEDNEMYLHICGWNLYEKHLRGMIPEEEWKRLEEVLK